VSRPVELSWRTPAVWARRALAETDALLSDHAHCELGAAAAAQGFVARAVADAELVERMAALAVEELRHFRRVHLLRERGGVLEPVRRNPYVEGLFRAARRDAGAGLGLLDRLLVAALVEARSLERFTLLAEHADGTLAALFRELGPSEAGHAALFFELARDRFPRRSVDQRLAVLARREGALLAGLAFAPRIHSGPPVQPAATAVEEARCAASAASLTS